MIHSRHLAAASLGILVLVLVGMQMSFSNKGGDGYVLDESLQLASPEAAMSVIIDAGDTRTKARESLLARLMKGDEGAKPASLESATPVIEANETETTPDIIEGESDPGGIAIGDGLISSRPENGSVFACVPQAEGTLGKLPWVRDGYWYPEERPTVEGSVFWPSAMEITPAEGARLIKGNGLPAHSTGEFPIASSDDAYFYRENESAIAPRAYSLQLPAYPQKAAFSSCLLPGRIGVALNGVPFYRALGTTGEDLGARTLLDRCGGTTSQSGEYHYFGESECLFDAYYEGAESTLLGYALDGFGIFANLEEGSRLTNNDLDGCHGHEHEIPWDGQMVFMYHYHMTDEYPYSIGCFMGASTSQ